MSRPTPHNQAVLDYLGSVLRVVRRADGWRTDLGESLWLDEPEFAPAGPDIGLIRTILTDYRISARGLHEYTLEVTIRGLVYAIRDGANLPRAAARAWLADIQDALGAAPTIEHPVGVEAIRFERAEIPDRDPQDDYLLPVVVYQIDYSNRAAL